MSDLNEQELRTELLSLETMASTVIPGLEKWLRVLHGFCKTMVLGVELSSDDHFAFMAIHFHAKQLEHVEALFLLRDHADTSLITRSMLEGLCLLKWAQQNPQARALQWSLYILVLNWRAIHAQQNEGISSSEIRSRKIQIEQQIIGYGNTLLNDKAIKAKRTNSPMPDDPYIRTWYRPQLRQIFEVVGDQDLYDGPYFTMSEWHHWSPGGLAQAMNQNDNTIAYSGNSDVVRTSSLVNAFKCLAETALIVNECLSLRQEEELTSLINGCVIDYQAHPMNSEV